MKTQVYCASTAFGLVTLSAALADGAFPSSERRVLVLSNNARIPEIAYGATDVAGVAPLVEMFDDVYSYNAVVAPQHPSAWQPRTGDLSIWERALRSLWSLEGDIHLVVESIQVAPARALCQTFADASIDVYADGLMSYGPTRNLLPAQVGARLERLLHPDLVPGVRPLLLREFDVTPVVISTESFTKVMAAVAAEAGPPGLATGARPTAVLLGQYLSALRLMTVEQERALYLQMVDGAVAAGFTELVFKAHPGATAGLTGPLVNRAQALGARLRVREAPELVETWYASGEVGLVIGCFSTALATAGFYGVPAARVGTELLLDRLKPYENSNRIPATVVNATLPRLDQLASLDTSAPPPPVSVGQLVETVGYVMQPDLHPELRARATEVLQRHFDALRPYVHRRRLTALDLPGSHGPGLAAQLGPAGRVLHRTLGPRLSRRLGNVARRLTGRRPR